MQQKQNKKGKTYQTEYQIMCIQNTSYTIYGIYKYIHNRKVYIQIKFLRRM